MIKIAEYCIGCLKYMLGVNKLDDCWEDWLIHTGMCEACSDIFINGEKQYEVIEMETKEESLRHYFARQVRWIKDLIEDETLTDEEKIRTIGTVY